MRCLYFVPSEGKAFCMNMYNHSNVLLGDTLLRLPEAEILGNTL